jgi:hypothetical protein
MNGSTRYHVAKAVIAERQREAELAGAAQQARAESRDNQPAEARQAAGFGRRIRALLRPRTA